MDFSEGPSPSVRLAVPVAAGGALHRFLADNLRSLLGFFIDLDFIGAVYLVIGEDAILKNEPPRPPSLAVIHPLLEDSSDHAADDPIQLDVAVISGEERGLRLQRSCTVAGVTVGVGLCG